MSGDEDFIWPIIHSYFKKFNINESKKQSFNKLLTEGLPSIIKNHSPIVVKYTHTYHVIDIEAVTMNKPIMTETDDTSHKLEPKEARFRQETYGADVYYHLRYRIFQMPNEDPVSLKVVIDTGVCIKDIVKPYVKGIKKYPVMVKSIGCHLNDASKDYGECSSDIGGYFIIEGAEKMLMYRERLAYNKIFLHPKKDGATSHFAEYRSEYYDQFRSTQTLNLEISRTTKTESASLYIQGIPWVTFIRALGLCKAKEIYTLFRFLARDRWNSVYKNLLKNSLKNHQGILTQDLALARIGSIAAPNEKTVTLLRNYGESYVRNKLLPNMGFTERDDIIKVFALCDMACRLFDYVQDSSLRTNKDSYPNKREESCEDLIGNLTRQFLVLSTQGVKLNILKKLKDNKTIDLDEVFSDDKVGKGIKESLASGMWHATKSKVTQTGVSQKLDRANYICTQAQQMKVINQLRKEVKSIAPRLLSSTSYGTVCPSDSPEGATCGLVKFNAILQHQSIGTNGNAIRHLLINSLGVVEFEELYKHQDKMREIVENQAHFVTVFLNGTPLGVYDDAIKVVQFVRDCRRKLQTSADTGVSFNKYQVDVRTDRGRNLRPLFVAENLHKLRDIDLENVKWNDLLARGIVEYVDKEEEQNLLIAIDLKTYLVKNCKNCKDEKTSREIFRNLNGEMFVNPYNPDTLDPIYYTHMEIHGSTFYGVSASLIPFPDHNQSPRNTYQCAMIRQAQGTHSSNSKKHRMDPSCMEMWYPQRPIVETSMHSILNCQNFPYGQNVMVAVCSAGEMGQEDANISLQSAIDFGMLRSSVYKMITISEKKQGKSENSEEFRKMDENKLSGRKKANYSHIEEDGLPAVGSPVEPGTVLAQKVILQKELLISKECPLEGKDMSVTSLNNESGRIDKVLITSTACGIKTVKIRVARVATTKEGDKFATRYGQKGVGGENKAAVDMMYTEDGIMPHFIINSLAFSSRMTWGEWIETLFATVCIVNGRFGNATPFSKQYRDALYKDLQTQYEHIHEACKNGVEFKKGHIVDEIADALIYLGLDPDGEHVMYNGSNGKKQKGRIFMGYTYLQKLKHMVKDKIRARGRGRMQALVRQAVEGRTLNGGLKFGEMERDCLSAHGCAFNIQDRMCFSSDPQYMHICTVCNNSVIFDEQCDKQWCPFCDKYDGSVVVLSNSSFKLFQQELIASNINIKLDVEEI